MQDLERSGLQADEECLDGEQELLGVLLDDVEGEGGECLHFPLDNSPGALHPEEDHKCERCHRSWQDLARKGSEKTNSLYTTDYPCNYEEKGYVVPNTYLVCPQCSQQKAGHLASLFTKVWMEEIE